MTSITQSSVPNKLISLLSKDDFQLIAENSELVELEVRSVLYEPDENIEFAYFPTDGICSVIAENSNGERGETGIIGKEGFLGSAIVLKAGSSPSQVVVQVGGAGLRMARKAFEKALEDSSSLQVVLLRYIHVFGTQAAQTALTNGNNTIEQRLARWMLMCQDRIESPDFTMTHDFLAVMLAVRRSGVTDALNILEGKGLIKTTRAHIAIRDRAGLLEVAAGAYGVPEKEYQRLLSPRVKAVLSGS